MPGTRLCVSCRHCRRLVAFVHNAGLDTLAATAMHLRRRHPRSTTSATSRGTRPGALRDRAGRPRRGRAAVRGRSPDATVNAYARERDEMGEARAPGASVRSLRTRRGAFVAVSPAASLLKVSELPKDWDKVSESVRRP